MNRFTPTDLLKAHPWERVLFTTFSLSLSFFEAVVRDALIRGGKGTPCETHVLADVEGVRNALSELGARGVGRDYEVEPVEVVNGAVFHPKVTLLGSKTETHLVIGSGNLTFGGWGGNLEAFEHLDVRRHADAFLQAADFFSGLATAQRLRMAAGEHCERAATVLRHAARQGDRPGTVRILHSLGDPILDQVAAIAEELGGAERLAIASPFWDDGKAVDRLCDLLGLDRVHIHSHSGEVSRGKGSNSWPWEATTKIEAVRFANLEPPAKANQRKLHAKLFEIICRRGRLVLSGSANASMAALHGGRNVEVCVARVSREISLGWSWTPASPPVRADTEEEDAKGDAPVGILRATVSGDELTGRVITKVRPGPVIASFQSAYGVSELEIIEIGAGGDFFFRHPGLEQEGLKGTRIVLQLAGDQGAVAQGFVAFPAYGEIRRNLGSAYLSFMNILITGGVPADIAAVMEWMVQNPGLIGRPQFLVGGGSATQEKESTERVRVDLHSLRGASRPGDLARGLARPTDKAVRIWDQFFRSLEAPGISLQVEGRPGEDEEDSSQEEGHEARRAAARAIERPARSAQGKQSSQDDGAGRTLKNFNHVFSRMVDGPAEEENLRGAFALTQAICKYETLRPSQDVVRGYLGRLVGAFGRLRSPDLQEIALAAIGVSLGDDVSRGIKEAFSRARQKVLRFGADPSCPPPDMRYAAVFRRVLCPEADIQALWSSIATVRSMPEQIRDYIEDLDRGTTTGFYPDLKDEKEFWSPLSEVLAGKAGRDRVIAVGRGTESCPKCNVNLPMGRAQSLAQRNLGRAPCCQRILLCGEV